VADAGKAGIGGERNRSGSRARPANRQQRLQNPGVLDYRRFFALEEAHTRGAFRVHALGEVPDPQALTRGELVPKHPIHFHHDQGGRLYDYIGTTWAVLDLVSDRVISVLRDNEFTGWSTYPIEVYDRDGHSIAGYHGLAATGRSGPIDVSLVMDVPPAGQGRGGAAAQDRPPLRARNVG
jgi:hypothetical protein